MTSSASYNQTSRETTNQSPTPSSNQVKIVEQKFRPRQPKKNVSKMPPTQLQIPFSEIRENIVIMRDGTLRQVLMVSSMNFALKSEEEQQGVIQAYMAFLNTLDFELQIVIQSRKLNVDKYLDKLAKVERQQDNELLRKQTRSYRSFVARLVTDANIMDKKFYVVVPYSPYSKKRKSYWTKFIEVFSPASSVKIKQEKMDKYKIELERRVNLVLAGLHAMGLDVEVLDTQGLIELYYNTYNPLTKQTRRIEDIDQMQVNRYII